MPNPDRRNTLSRLMTAAVFAFALLAGCGSELEGFLSDLNLFPNADSITDDIRAACDGVMAENEIVSALVAARLDSFNGYTKDEERATAIQNCTIDAIFSETPVDDCIACKSAILDEIYGP